MGRSSDGYDRKRNVGYLVNHAGRLFARALDRRLAAYGVSHGPFPLLLVLWEEERITQSEIARRLDIEQPTVANTLKRMERDGWVTTEPDPANARRVLIVLTAKGRELETALIREAEAVNAMASQALEATEIESLRTALAKVIANLSASLQD